MSEVICYDSYGEAFDHLTQWDINQKIIVEGLKIEPVPVFHICNICSECAYVVSPILDGTNLVIDIPNILLQQRYPILLYAYYSYDDDSSKTGNVISLPVHPRVRPDDYEFVENIEYVNWAAIEEEARALIDELQNEVDRGIRLIISEAEPQDTNILWFDTGEI